MRQELEVSIADDLRGGVYANVLMVWHTAHEFTLDFVATEPGREGRDPQGEAVAKIPARVTARVKVPPGVLFDIMRALNTNMTLYEQQFGAIRRPGEAAGGADRPPDD